MPNANVLTPFNPTPTPYHHQEFPKMLHHSNGRQRIVNDEVQERRIKASDRGWSDFPSYPKYYEHLDGRQAIIRNAAEEDILMATPDGRAGKWALHPCSERLSEPEKLPASAPEKDPRRGQAARSPQAGE